LDLKALSGALDAYVKPGTLPLAVKMVPPGEELPEKVRIPSRDLKKRLAICQVFNMTRRYGWAMALGREDQNCPIGSVALGFEEAVPYYTEGNLADGMYTSSLEAGRKSEEAVRRFPLGKYAYLLVAPIARATFEPDFAYVYVNPAQLMRLVQAALYKEGGALTSTFSGRGECAETIVNTMESGQCQVIMPGNGERVFGHTQDDEMAFTIPAAKVDEVSSGLEGTHKAGVRYPIPVWLNYEVSFPPKYTTLQDTWAKRGE
jgi:uncharacterized protein (DUF169 family)